MTTVPPATPTGSESTEPRATGLRSNLGQRVIAALVLAPVALGAAYLGSWALLLLAVIAAGGLFLEWLSVIGALHNRATVGLGIVALLAVAVLTMLHHPGHAVALAAVAALLMAPAAYGHVPAWHVVGLAYAAAALVATVVLRGADAAGLIALIFVFAVVWVTDILGYFVGRALGGPKLWPRISPKKTWSGALGGLIGSVLVGVVFALLGAGRMLPLALVALLLSVVSQSGDLFESAFKRRFAVKDSSQIIPGHGGLLDRLDGFVAAVVAAAFIGALHGGPGRVAQGLLQW